MHKWRHIVLLSISRLALKKDPLYTMQAWTQLIYNYLTTGSEQMEPTYDSYIFSVGQITSLFCLGKAPSEVWDVAYVPFAAKYISVQINA